MIRLNDPGTANGEIRMWVDGALQVEETGIEMRFEGYTGISFNQLFYGFYYHEGSPIEQTFWTDHIIVADAPLNGPVPDDDGTEPVPDLPPDAPADVPPDAAPDAAVDPGVDTPADMTADSPPPDGSDDPGADEDGEGCGCAVVV